MPDGGMYAPPAFGMCATPKRAGRPRYQAARNDAMIARRSQTSQDDVCATPDTAWAMPSLQSFATPERDSSLRSVESAVLGGVSMCP